MRKYISFGIVLFAVFIQGCQNSGRLPPSEEINSLATGDEVKILEYPSATTSVPFSSTPPAPTVSPTAPIFDHSMFVESLAEGFSMVEANRPLDFIEEEAVDPTGKYRALEVCDSYCDIYVEDLGSGVVYILAAPSLRRTRIYADLTWSDEAVLEFVLVSQPHYGVRFVIDVEIQKIIDAVPTTLE